MKWNETELSSDFDALTARQQKVIPLLLEKPTVHEAAKAARVGVVTVFRWLREENFQNAYRKTRADSVKQAVAQIQAAMGTAVQTLIEIMEDTEAPASSRVSAAKTMLETGIRAVEVEEIEARLAAIEKIIKEKNEVQE